jgi:hypothetical protein
VRRVPPETGARTGSPLPCMMRSTPSFAPFLAGIVTGFFLFNFKFTLHAIDTAAVAPSAASPAVYDPPTFAIAGRKKVLAVVGVQTGFTTNRLNPKYDYLRRRQALRASWFPANRTALAAFEASSEIILRFVAGHSADATAEEELNEEEAQFGGFMRLPLQEEYQSLTNKTLTFFRHVAQTYDADYIIKLDDDVYARLDRLGAAVAQWRSAGVDYVGCMKRGPIHKSPTLRWYEPKHVLLGDSYFTHCWGSAYALSQRAAHIISTVPADSLRFFANEDVTIGSWMIAFNVTHYHDQRLCAPACTDSSLVVYDFPKCAGLCDPPARLAELHADVACHAPPTSADPDLLPIHPSNARF